MGQPSRKEIQIKDRKNKLAAYQDKRYNLNKITDDKSLNEIDFYIAKYTSLTDEFHKKSMVSKIKSAWLLYVLIFCMCLIYSPIIFGDNMLSGVYRTGFNYVFTVTLAIFVGNYFSNKMNGHTRAWSRNRLLLERLEILRREFELSVHKKNSEFIKVEQENILTKLFELEIENRIEAHKDIVGDYSAAHEGTFSWIKELRK